MAIPVAAYTGERQGQRDSGTWDIRIEVEEQEATALLIATSHQLPGLLAVATCEEELADALPAIVQDHCRRRLGQQVDVCCKVTPSAAICTCRGD